ncbi:hypothetical protein OG394_00030 [Kribbella sp. NBC_01245]|uniref:hypothetical protein n=1 Tax=Kribbella sp. NBC_01245 TaxID=2903578 RepID=UPI002E2C28A8|nr:hypothetical protein [Kribbella sp. NBC_01245]
MSEHGLFDPLLTDLSDRSRDEVLAAFSAVQYAAQPVAEVQLAGLRDVTLRRQVQKMLKLIGRTLVNVAGTHWTSGYLDDVAETLTAQGWQPLSAVDRAVLVLVLVHSVAIPRSEGILTGDSWKSARPTTVDELRTAKISSEDRRLALQRLRAAGLVQLAGDRSGGPSYVPGPQLQRLTPAARRRLQDQLILAAAPASPIAAAIRARTGSATDTEQDLTGVS